jgi:hypothetical protein
VIERFVFQIATQKLRQHFSGVHALAIGFGKVRRTIVVDHAGNPAGHLRIRTITFELRDPGCQSKKQRQVSAGRSSDSSDSIGIYSKPLGVGP